MGSDNKAPQRGTDLKSAPGDGAPAMQTDNKLLLVDDDEVYCGILARALARRGFDVSVAYSRQDALARAAETVPDLAVVDLRIGADSGLELIPELLGVNPVVRIIVLTGYASIATAVEAIKLGAVQYLTKPADAEDILTAVQRETGAPDVALRNKPLPLARLEWEHIQKTLAECDGNISAAARRLGMHRRTLQRKLQKRPVRAS